MKNCKICDKKHHAKGYCKTHYRTEVLKPSFSKQLCSIDNCEKPISIGYTKQKLCEMHGARLKRHGNVNDRTRAREIASIVNELKECDNVYDFEMPNRNTWAHIAKLVYGSECMRCGWTKGNCDVHHKIYHRNGGKNTLNNAEVICPNCHRLEHQKTTNYYSEETKALILQFFN